MIESSFPEKTVLLVDDEPLLRQALAKSFARRKLRVLEAGGGDSAFELLKSQSVDVIISDVKMPQGCGISLLQKIRADKTNSSRVILISGFADISREEAMEAGAQALLQKPFQFNALWELVVGILTGQRTDE